ncbi:MAG: aminotransferase class III-fold pyridoxal phosphate-dependent enzyme [Gammaproteobacteria bacterium]|nr:aminotransferase class III-fold pyridoxal phosphate-dependent enzyme [Gammaproteobacteria bacterium]
MAPAAQPRRRALPAADGGFHPRAAADRRAAFTRSIPAVTTSSADPGSLLARRARLLAPTYQLFYEQPLQLVRAAGVWMYDQAGRRYLDAYNNVPVVGHCHPRVVAALTHQARTLNTHTRYLAEQPLQLAEQLLATLSLPDGRVIFTCTGSEANDLAVRIAKGVTGGRGFIITEFAYHGVTDAIAGMSPEDGGPLGPGVYTVAAPLGPQRAASFGERVRECIGRMQADGVGLAGMLVDTIFSSDGVCAEPRGFLADAVNAVHAAGGLFIADEVQPGFGRLGEAMWGFQRHGIVPDLVTMGKPMGNGHPVAAVAGRSEVFAQFARGRRYFNTYGGNSVSCATALAVLEVISAEQLLENARHSGAQLQRGLRALAQRHSVIREVRGAGLFLGVQLGANPASGLSGAAETRRIVNGMCRRGVLVGATGRDGDVLKIRPPLTLEAQHAELLLTALDQTLQSAT